LTQIPGTRLGAYEVVAQLGVGGMGEVYRATDTTLKRQVALKVLPASVASDADRLARFQREAEVLAALNHPNIAAIYGIERSGDTTALVMELVEGEDLSQRIARGAIPLDEALPIATQIAEALEAAHEQGIIHRDLKPANVKVRPDGTVKVLDFGLAKAMEPAAGSSSRMSMSPTITTPAMTQAGMILGTAAYMSPEQAKGRAVDKRTDVWAFGAVLYEMLTGKRAFEGEDVSETLARILMKEPDWAALPATVPPAVVTATRRCLQKDRKLRARDIGDVSLALEGAFESAAPQATGHRPQPISAATRAVPWAIASVAVIVAGVMLTLWAPWRSTTAPALRRLLASIGADASMPTDVGASAILSPDGTTLAFIAQEANQTRLFVRKLDQLQAAALVGTEGAASPFFSPDGQWVAFFAGGKLKKVSTAGGAAVTLCDVPNGRGGTWADDGTILFSPSGNANVRLMRVSAAGGTPAVFGTLSGGATTQRWPQAIPGANAVLYTEHSALTNFDGATLVVAPLSGGTPKVVVRGGHYGRYLSSGHLIYLQQGTLFAVRFDLNRLETIGQAVPALEDVTANPRVNGGAQLAVSSEGTLVYVRGTAAAPTNPLDWMTRDGKTSVLRPTKADWGNPRFSPDGQKLALDISDGKQRDIWVYEWARDTLTQLTFDPGDDRLPVWTPDGRRIVFASDRAKAGILNLYEVNADGTGEVTRLTDSPDTQLPNSWHPSGKFLAFQANRAKTGPDLMILPMEGDAARGWTPGKPTVFLSTPANEGAAMFSPDGRWIAYFSSDGSRSDVYVRPFPGPGGTWRVSTAGGIYPRWSAITHELLFLPTLAQGKIMAAPYAVVGESFRADTPQIWSPTDYQGASATNAAYDLHPDGKRLAVRAAQDHGSAVQNQVVFVSNFADYLRKIVPGTK
jgi:serine/threonine protein kinase/Tol biopolymer transport system component